MTKQESIAYLRKLVLKDKLSLPTETNPEAAAELNCMEKSPEDEEKNLTTDPSSV
jgi:hypothetical protein